MKSPVPPSTFWVLLFVAQLPLLVLYLLRLYQDPLYGWWPLFALLFMAGLIWMRWDGITQLPRRRLPLLGLVLGLLAGLCAGLLGSGWLAGLSFCCTSGSWLATHQQRSGARLSSIWFISWSLLQIPLGGNDWLTQSLGNSLELATESLLRLGQVPHVNYGRAVEVLSGRIYFDQAIYSTLGWPLFVAIAMGHSAVQRRTWVEALLNFVSAIFWCFAFHCGLLLSCLQLGLPLNSWGAAGLSFLWSGTALALFLSTEHGFRLLLQPISESSFASRTVNPYVIAWNFLFSSDSPRGNRRRLEKPRKMPATTAWLLLSCLTVTLLLQLASIPGAWASLSRTGALTLDQEALQASVFNRQSNFEHRRSHYNPPLVRNRQVDVWTVYAPLSTTEHIVENYPQPVFELQSLLSAGGWQVDSAEPVPVKMPDGQSFTCGDIALHHGKQHARVLYTWLAVDGRPLPLSGDSDSGYLLMSKVELVKVYEAATKRVQFDQFSRLVEEVQTQLCDQSSPQ